MTPTYLVPLREFVNRPDQKNNTLFTEAIEACINLGSMCEHENDSMFPPNAGRYALKNAVKNYFFRPEKMWPCWAREFLRFSTKAIDRLCQKERYNKAQWHSILLDVLERKDYHPTEIKLFCLEVIAVTCSEPITA